MPTRGGSAGRIDRETRSLHRPTEPRRERQAALIALIAPKAQEPPLGQTPSQSSALWPPQKQGRKEPFDPIGETAAPEPEAHGAATGEAQAAAAVRGGRAGIVSG